MNDTDNSKPDVEAIVDELRQHIDDAERSIPEAHRASTDHADNLQAHLDEVNKRYMTCSPLEGWREFILRPLQSWRTENNAFNMATVRVLNRLARLLKGEDLPESGSILDSQKRRLTLMEKMNDRLAEYDRLEIEERLKKLEARLDEAERKRNA